MIQLTVVQTKEELIEAVRNSKTYFSAFKVLIQIENDYTLKSSLGIDYDNIKTALVNTFNLDECFNFPSTYVTKDDLINFASLCRRLSI